MLRIFGLKNCDTCRAAAQALGVEIEDVRAQPLDAGRIAAFHAAFGAALVNRRSTTWRGLSETERALPEPALIAAHPAVMKRPVIEADDGALHLGWTGAVRAALGADQGEIPGADQVGDRGRGKTARISPRVAGLGQRARAPI